MYSSKKIKLKVLVCDAQLSTADVLRKSLQDSDNVLKVSVTNTIKDAKHAIASDDYNTIFIDPLSIGLEDGSNFIFGVRETNPEIVFVLYIDKSQTESRRAEFYQGERRRFSHYYQLDKQIPVAIFKDELAAIISSCKNYLSYSLSTASLDRLQKEAKTATESKVDIQSVELIEQMQQMISQLPHYEKETTNRSKVFLSYKFAEEEYISGLSNLLKQSGFEIVTGKSANTYVSKAIIDRINSCDFFLCLMTRQDEKTDGTYTTSPWLLEEKGVALAFSKPLVLMIEEGVSDFGGLQGDWQRIHFGEKGFLNAALEAVAQLKSYVGGDE